MRSFLIATIAVLFLAEVFYGTAKAEPRSTGTAHYHEQQVQDFVGLVCNEKKTAWDLIATAIDPEYPPPVIRELIRVEVLDGKCFWYLKTGPGRAYFHDLVVEGTDDIYGKVYRALVFGISREGEFAPTNWLLTWEDLPQEVPKS